MQADPPRKNGHIQETFVRVRDGLKLHVTKYIADMPTGRPAVCLPGLTRNGRDFHDLACFLSKSAPSQRNVYAIDYRGRGLSDWDTNWKNYAVPIEALDTVDVLAALNIHDVAFVGTSRGGLITMLLAGLQPTAIGACVLNDIGPVVETDGLIRISSFVGRVPLPRTWAEATNSARELNQKKFPAVPDELWEDIARQWYNDKKGRPSQGYDPELKNALSVLDGPMPTLWPQFQALTRVPLMVLRGEHSDILTQKTVEQMQKQHQWFESLTVPGQGHPPLLKDKMSLEAIANFLQSADQPTRLQVSVPAENKTQSPPLDTHLNRDEPVPPDADATAPEPKTTANGEIANKRRPLVDRL